jgi:hypothetical protein
MLPRLRSTSMKSALLPTFICWRSAQGGSLELAEHLPQGEVRTNARHAGLVAKARYDPSRVRHSPSPSKPTRTRYTGGTSAICPPSFQVSFHVVVGKKSQRNKNRHKKREVVLQVVSLRSGSVSATTTCPLLPPSTCAPASATLILPSFISWRAVTSAPSATPASCTPNYKDIKVPLRKSMGIALPSQALPFLLCIRRLQRRAA